MDMASESFTCIISAWGMLMTMFHKLSDLDRWAKENHLTQFMKILVTFFQILGSFTMFSIEWPPVAYTLIAWFQSTFKFEILQMPGLSCFWNGVSFHSSLTLMTIAPLAIMATFMLPVLLAVIRGYSPYLHKKHIEAYRWTETLDKFWTSIMFVLFGIYPAVSIATMRAFNCDVNLGLLKDDYREVCPPLLSTTCIYSGCFFLLYPIGIPAFMNYSLR
jgi:hypothetical protein